MAGVHQLDHPLVRAELSKLRNSERHETGIKIEIVAKPFSGHRPHRSHARSRGFQGVGGTNISRRNPVAAFEGTTIKPRIGLTPILRAGLGMTDALLTLFPSAPVYHLGLFREKVTLQPVEYYSKLPPFPPVDIVYLLDPLIATGGTAVAALGMIVDWGIPAEKIKLLCVLASEKGLNNVQTLFPELEAGCRKVYSGVDEVLTKEGIISPGLGDTGDRLFNTIRP
ncbi:hypothetical protein D9757_000144 [Collybiopsis confluens]|uniref:uracil phosphoribosyltransferase n=1 Tax=Collybiopsis confluens TaxID=2823264 RepID=A0A8H5MHD2_9AGAR|nr:hypothetical protein D9757_000144 [Collybiopsis confluens]